MSFFSDKFGLKVIVSGINKRFFFITLNIENFLLVEAFKVERNDFGYHFLVVSYFFKGFGELG